MAELLQWLNENAAATQAASAVLQLLAALALIAVTARYVILTGMIARETQTMAHATRAAVEQAQAQHRDSTLPVLLFELCGHGGDAALHTFAVNVKNGGCGPALDVQISVVAALDGLEYRQHSTPPFQPFGLPAGDNQEIGFYHPRQGGDWPASGAAVGTLRATYRDIHSRQFVSETLLQAQGGGAVTLGALHYQTVIDRL